MPEGLTFNSPRACKCGSFRRWALSRRCYDCSRARNLHGMVRQGLITEQLAADVLAERAKLPIRRTA